MPYGFVDISGLDKAEVLKALYDGTRTIGMGFLASPDAKKGVTIEDFRKLIENAGSCLNFDYVFGRPLKVDISKDEFDPRLYDRDAGPGRAEEVINAICEKLTAPKGG